MMNGILWTWSASIADLDTLCELRIRNNAFWIICSRRESIAFMAICLTSLDRLVIVPVEYCLVVLIQELVTIHRPGDWLIFSAVFE